MRPSTFGAGCMVMAARLIRSARQMKRWTKWQGAAAIVIALGASTGSAPIFLTAFFSVLVVAGIRKFLAYGRKR